MWLHFHSFFLFRSMWDDETQLFSICILSVCMALSLLNHYFPKILGNCSWAALIGISIVGIRPHLHVKGVFSGTNPSLGGTGMRKSNTGGILCLTENNHTGEYHLLAKRNIIGGEILRRPTTKIVVGLSIETAVRVWIKGSLLCSIVLLVNIINLNHLIVLINSHIGQTFTILRLWAVRKNILLVLPNYQGKMMSRRSHRSCSDTIFYLRRTLLCINYPYIWRSLCFFLGGDQPEWWFKWCAF